VSHEALATLDCFGRWLFPLLVNKTPLNASMRHFPEIARVLAISME
jgi:hypothetical protein